MEEERCLSAAGSAPLFPHSGLVLQDSPRMLNTGIMEEFVTEEEEPWYDQQDLEQAGENSAGEKQGAGGFPAADLDVLRDMNEQHAKVYEQLDGTARELERTNVSLVIDSKNSHQKIERSVEQLRSMEQLRVRREKRERRKTIHSFPCLRELCTAPGYEDQFVVGRAESFTVDAKRPPFEEENQHLREAVSALRGAARTERGRREGDAESCQARVRELEVELQELQQLRRARTFLMSSEDDGTTITQTVLNSTRRQTPSWRWRRGAACERRMKVGEERRRGISPGVQPREEELQRHGAERHRCSRCKYEELLGKCRRHEESLCHAGVQTSRPVSRDPSMKDCAIGPTPVPPPTPTQSPSTPEAMESISKQVDAVDKRLGQNTPEYKALFKEIFSRIQKTKMDIKATKVAKASKSGKSGKSSKQ
ncbi:hypothetical protein F7725_013747 [Dissostichus mawsoni]|uniref:Uncharacterized protein n=1 Tax=Dissostichus mawsoni TaxID=36200 RepID=A0A7J5YWF7_DISMA|nr:hypothetical protein F7725_013747 [Dissostichus mawsoni]